MYRAGRRVLVCWTGETVVGVDPASGSIYWIPILPNADDQGSHRGR